MDNGKQKWLSVAVSMISADPAVPSNFLRENFSANEISQMADQAALKIPTRLFGDGLDAYRGFIKLEEAQDEETAVAIKFLSSALLALSSPPSMGDYANPFSEMVSDAIEILAEHGVEYEGLHDTFGYIEDGAWVQVREDIARALIKRRRDWEQEMVYPSDNQDEAIKLHLKRLRMYPWRRVNDLHTLSRIHAFGENTRLDFALCLLDNYRHYRYKISSIHDGSENRSFSRSGSLSAASSIARIGINVGWCHRAMTHKKFDVNAVRDLKAQINRSEGGRQSSPGAEMRFRYMCELVEAGHSPEKAAQLLEQEGQGKFAANKKLYQRRQAPKLS